jgi:hypothetical protein
MNSKNPSTKSTKQSFFIPAHFSSRRLRAVPPSDTPDDAMSGEAGPAPGRRVVADLNSRPAATVSLRTKGLTRVMGSDAPQNLDTLIGRTCLRGTQTRRPRCREHPDSGAEKTAGMSAGPQMAGRSSPGRGSRSDWCTIRREPPGPPARLWQTFPREDSVSAGPTPGQSLGRRSRRPSPPCQRDACSGKKRRTRRRKEPHKTT